MGGNSASRVYVPQKGAKEKKRVQPSSALCSLRVLLCLLLPSMLLATSHASSGVQRVAVSTTGGSSALLRLATVELERYMYQTAIVADDASGGGTPVTPTLRLWVLDLSNHVAAEQAAAVLHRCTGTNHAGLELHPQEHVVHRCHKPSDDTHFVMAGGDDMGALYATYYFVEHVLGVGFSIAGDRVPSPRTLDSILRRAQQLDCLGSVVAPRFSLRGIQPFHDFRGEQLARPQCAGGFVSVFCACLPVLCCCVA